MTITVYLLDINPIGFFTAASAFASRAWQVCSHDDGMLEKINGKGPINVSGLSSYISKVIENYYLSASRLDLGRPQCCNHTSNTPYTEVSSTQQDVSGRSNVAEIINISQSTHPQTQMPITITKSGGVEPTILLVQTIFALVWQRPTPIQNPRVGISVLACCLHATFRLHVGFGSPELHWHQFAFESDFLQR